MTTQLIYHPPLFTFLRVQLHLTLINVAAQIATPNGLGIICLDDAVDDLKTNAAIDAPSRASAPVLALNRFC